MEQLWSISTTIREAERIEGFLATAAEIDGEKWNHETQAKFQILLVKNRLYLSDPDNSQVYGRLNKRQCDLLRDKSIRMTYDEAASIIQAKQYVGGPEMRGRQSLSPLRKLGLVFVINGRVTVTDIGRKLLNKEISFSDFILSALLKFQYSNPEESEHKKWNTKPFINALRLIKRVNELCVKNGEKPKGISKTEFGIFVLSLKNYNDIDRTAEKLLQFREEYLSYSDEQEREYFRETFVRQYLSDFRTPEKNTIEYADNVIRYMRLTKYIYIRGKYSNTYVDLEPRRMTEIDAILDNDDGSAKPFSPEEWYVFMGTYDAYVLPFETEDKLKEILCGIDNDISVIEKTLGIKNTYSAICVTCDDYKEEIENRRAYRTLLQNLLLKVEYHRNTSRIDEAIKALEDIRDHNKVNLAKRYSIELEKWANVALNIINDSDLIKPNAPVGDDNEPTYTAPNGVPDIECYYESFNAICEVTMLTSRDQWYNEGQPVMRHLRNFERESDKASYCLFIAPRLHQDTVNTFYISVKYEYEGAKQKILPITITQLVSILTTIKTIIMQGKSFKHIALRHLYDKCVDMACVTDSSSWLNYIEEQLSLWEQSLTA